MIRNWSIKHSLIAGAVLILLSNTVALSGVYYNRSGQADSTVTLTERELGVPYAWRINKENSGLSLRLIWNVAKRDDGDEFTYRSNFPDWLDANKLAELGFDVEGEKLKHNIRRLYRRILPREAYLVLEFDGDTYQSVLKRAQKRVRDSQRLVNRNIDKKEFIRKLKNAETRLKRLTESDTRLYVIDANLDQQALRNKYSDRSKYIIAKGTTRMWLGYGNKNRDPDIGGYIGGLSVARINISQKHRAGIEALLDDKKSRHRIEFPPRYAVKVSWGKRLEPWVREIVELEQ